MFDDFHAQMTIYNTFQHSPIDINYKSIAFIAQLLY